MAAREETKSADADVKKEEAAEEPKAPVAEAKKELSPFYASDIESRVVIAFPVRRGRNARMNVFVERVKRILRSTDKCTLHGVDDGISMAVTVVELLKRDGIVKQDKVSTNRNMTEWWSDWSHYRPSSYLSIDFELSRGPNAVYITDGRQRRLIELFEKHDPDKTGKLAKDKIVALNLPEVFYADEDLQAAGKKYLDSIKGDSLTLPEFIKYCSAIVHHKLRRFVFMDRLDKKCGILWQTRGGRRPRDGLKDTRHDDDIDEDAIAQD